MKRYDISGDCEGDCARGCLARMLEDPAGDWVAFDDAEAAIAARDAAIARLRALEAAARELRALCVRPRRGMSVDVGPGFVRVRECPGCLHTRCGEDCVCNCDAERAEAEADVARNTLGQALDEIERLSADLARLRGTVCNCPGCGLLLRLGDLEAR